MKVFVSWSGDKSRDVALALREWLPGVINSVEPFVSSKDIYAGTRWQAEIAAELAATHFAIVCVTRDNQRSPWLNFEAGALAKAVESSRVVPLAVDLKPSDVEIPLGQFQAQPATEQGIAEIVRSINAANEHPLADALLEKACETWWPQLQEALARIDRAPLPDAAPERTDRELLEETLNTVRSLARNRSRDPVAGDPTVPLGDDHPLVAEISALLDGDEVMTHHHARRIGIADGHRLPQKLQDAIVVRARSHGAEVDFLGPPPGPE